jgi:hypothetical protein
MDIREAMIEEISSRVLARGELKIFSDDSKLASRVAPNHQFLTLEFGSHGLEIRPAVTLTCNPTGFYSVKTAAPILHVSMAGPARLRELLKQAPTLPTSEHPGSIEYGSSDEFLWNSKRFDQLVEKVQLRADLDADELCLSFSGLLGALSRNPPEPEYPPLPPGTRVEATAIISWATLLVRWPEFAWVRPRGEDKAAAEFREIEFSAGDPRALLDLMIGAHETDYVTGYFATKPPLLRATRTHPKAIDLDITATKMTCHALQTLRRYSSGFYSATTEHWHLEVEHIGWNWLTGMLEQNTRSKLKLEGADIGHLSHLFARDAAENGGDERQPVSVLQVDAELTADGIFFHLAGVLGPSDPRYLGATGRRRDGGDIFDVGALYPYALLVARNLDLRRRVRGLQNEMSEEDVQDRISRIARWQLSWPSWPVQTLIYTPDRGFETRLK